jgi:membrane protein
MKKILLWYKQGLQFVTYDMWHVKKTHVDADDTRFIKFLKIVFITVRGFFADRISLRASALTFYTLIAIVPVLSLFLGIAKGFGLHENLVVWLQHNFEQQQDLLKILLEFSDSMLGRVGGGLFTGISVVFLLWAVLSLLNNIEISFNHIWQVHRNRPWVRKFTDYLSVILIAPIFLIVSSSITVALHRHVTEFVVSAHIYAYTAPLVKAGFKLLSYVLLWLMFTFLYTAMPFTKVKFTSALAAGVVAGTAFQLVQHFYIYSQVVISKYSAIYGSFAAIPLFLLWAQTSWLILLFGAKLSYAIQNVTHYENDATLQELSIRRRKQLTLLIVHQIVKGFERGDKPMSSSEIAKTLNISVRIVRDIIRNLLQCGIINEIVTGDPQENAYQPAMDIHAITVGKILESIETQGADYDRDNTLDEQPLSQLLMQISDANNSQAGNVKIMEAV